MKQKHKTKIFNLKMFNRFLFILIIASSVCYLKGINDLSVNGFKIQELKHKISIISEENKENELKIMALESLNNLDEKVKELNMVAVGEIDYITSSIEVVAMK
ncbi:MAG: hypothetical protein ABIA02_01960 [Candidatus Falkowbacteria bacterium]